MATKTKKSKSLNESLVNATTSTINAAVENGEKWQNLTKKLIKKSEPIRKKQMDMVFDTAAAVKNQVNTGKEKAMDLVGYDQAIEYAKNNPVSKKVIEVTENIKGVTENIKGKVAENPVVKQVEKTTETIKAKTEDITSMGAAKLNEIKGDVLEQAQKILNKGEEMVEGALGTKKEAKKPAAKAPAAKKASAPKKATPAKATPAKAAAAPKKAPVAKVETKEAPKAAEKK